ncbi:MAG: DNA polymerase IV [Firmicutes bacterium HGW-Firmicutes-20]|nr:MAG: DNA polymerase IV [Firmicutes bacterium HGW-Firmicutes-20]PKM86723.1 MAG: DNA polymerase IV [Firmicutes bacterium HGW-Firmicutes-10]
MGKIIFHIDINAFFASAETLRDPSLKNKPIAVCSNKRGSVVTTANYIAREYGVRSAMPLAEALKLCPQLVVTGVHFDLYDKISSQFVELCKKYTEIIEVASVDECYLDVTEVIKQYRRPLDLALVIRRDIKKNIGLEVSIGIAPNRFLAKMASDMKKPNGMTVLRQKEVQSKLWPLPIERMHGIGIKSAELLKNAGIFTIGDLAVCDSNLVLPIFKKNTEIMIRRANGEDDSELDIDPIVKSLSQSTTLTNATSDYDEITVVIEQLCRELQQRCIDEGVLAQQVTITVKDDMFQSYTRTMKLPAAANSHQDFFENALLLFDANFSDITVKLLGVGCSHFIFRDIISEQLKLF